MECWIFMLHYSRYYRALARASFMQEQINWARYQTGVLHKDMEQLQQALEIFGDLMEKTPATPALWQQLSSEQRQALSRQLAYENYLND